jgi:hypothetical protein
MHPNGPESDYFTWMRPESDYFTLLFYSLSEFILNPGESMESMESIERLFYSLSEFILNPGLSMEDIECAISGIDPV